MAEKEFSHIDSSLIIFVDIVDSSVYSSILGIESFAKKVIAFQKLFNNLGDKYFKDKDYFKDENKKTPKTFLKISAQGDEGIVFLVDPSQDPADILNNAIRFACELKAKVKLQNLAGNDIAPREMKIAIGIHYGEVALTTESKNQLDGSVRRFIEEIIGYSINYGKRIESNSRIGKYSQIMLSKEAVSLLQYAPILFEKYSVNLKGIENSEDVFEIKSAFLEDIPINTNYEEETDFFKKYIDKVKELNFLREPWLKSFVVSVLNTQLNRSLGTLNKDKYQDLISDFVFENLNEDDPILLYWRARDYEENEKITKSIDYLKNVIQTYPEFIYAKIKLVELMWKFINQKNNKSAEMIFVRDTADEFLTKYPHLLEEKEKSLLKEISNKIVGSL